MKPVRVTLGCSCWHMVHRSTPHSQQLGRLLRVTYHHQTPAVMWRELRTKLLHASCAVRRALITVCKQQAWDAAEFVLDLPWRSSWLYILFGTGETPSVA
uniref:Uncharacterized protein n=1 Tax=Aegilops tauschii subsp. strangulata TaxID=200361 RepID=A0A453BX30_AEGTS